MNAKKVVNKMWDDLVIKHDPKAIENNVDPDYRQHSPYVKTGPDGLRDLMESLGPDYRYELVRMISQGDYVVMHGIHFNWLNGVFTGGDAVVGIDMFRVANNRIAEHWDVSVPLTKASVSGRGQLDGPATVEKSHLTDKSKKAGEGYVKTILIERKIDQIHNFVKEDVKQHNIEIGDGIDNLKTALQGTMQHYIDIHHVIADGEFVAVHSGGTVSNQVYTFWDLFHIDDNGIIDEQWQVAAVYPDDVKHTNGPF